RPVYQASTDTFQLSPGDEQLVVDLKYTDSAGVDVSKRFTFRRGDYLIDIAYAIDNTSEQAWQATLFGQIKRGSYPDPTQGTRMGKSSFLGFASTSSDDSYMKIPFDDIDNGYPSHSLAGGWLAMSQHYFLSAF